LPHRPLSPLCPYTTLFRSAARRMIAVDWGSTHLRMYRLGADGTLHKRVRSGQGTLASRGHFGEVLRHELAGWDEGPVLLCGMVGDRKSTRLNSSHVKISYA